jgi:hypothetical protein
MRPRLGATALSLLIGTIVAIAACGQSGAATASPGATTAAVATPPPATAGPTLGGLPTFGLPSFTGDKDLEAMMPKQIGGENVTVVSLNGQEFLAMGSSPELDAMLKSLNKQPSDLSVAFAGTTGVTVIAFRVKGVPAGQIFPALVEAYKEGVSGAPTQVSFAGKSVTKFTPSGSSPDEAITYIYTAGDTVFAVGGMGEVPDATLTEIFSKLP